MSSEDIHAILRAPGKIVIALAVIIAGGGSIGIVYNDGSELDAELRECRAIVEEHADRIVELEKENAGDIANFRSLQPRDNPFEGHVE